MVLTKIRQTFNRPKIDDKQIEEVVRQQMSASGVNIANGAHIALAVGSRGIANLKRIVKAAAEWVKEQGGEPFIVPAMGSHGGATAEGQRAVLEGYGITAATIGAPILSSMEVVELPQGELEHPVYMDKYAYESDGVILINRVKVHTDYHGAIESGLMKMAVIGLGKHKQALVIHGYGLRGLKELLVPTARQVLQSNKILLGVAIAENAYDETAQIRALLPANIEREEMQMLDWVKANMPKLPVRQIDVLIVDEFGKDISGVGIDPNIIGRIKIPGEPEPEYPDITSIMLLDLTDGSHGNAIGIGLADIITRRVFDKIDLRATYENVVTSSFLDRGFIPIIVDDERTGLAYALRSRGRADLSRPRILRMKNSLHLEELWVSQAILEEVRGRDNIEITGETQEFNTGE
ncbi:hypothetical protein U14_04918 [Candidatus Moduliflexus flocculans]|uniref:Uncharacterized protein n=1 Tax=Candidatus Moduliflexus flocculans TaxID=1499966 RepID=A0A0S6W666_9BACT|nr:hypothetical protein U14_04918 [Candidatus Moduliflexus flocculans]